MAKGARSSVKKRNKATLRAAVFGPAADRRTERLSAKLQELSSQTLVKDAEMADAGFNLIGSSSFSFCFTYHPYPAGPPGAKIELVIETYTACLVEKPEQSSAAEGESSKGMYYIPLRSAYLMLAVEPTVANIGQTANRYGN